MKLWTCFIWLVAVSARVRFDSQVLALNRFGFRVQVFTARVSQLSMSTRPAVDALACMCAACANVHGVHDVHLKPSWTFDSMSSASRARCWMHEHVMLELVCQHAACANVHSVPDECTPVSSCRMRQRAWRAWHASRAPACMHECACSANHRGCRRLHL